MKQRKAWLPVVFIITRSVDTDLRRGSGYRDAGGNNSVFEANRATGAQALSMRNSQPSGRTAQFAGAAKKR